MLVIFSLKILSHNKDNAYHLLLHSTRTHFKELISLPYSCFPFSGQELRGILLLLSLTTGAGNSAHLPSALPLSWSLLSLSLAA